MDKKVSWGSALDMDWATRRPGDAALIYLFKHTPSIGTLRFQSPPVDLP